LIFIDEFIAATQERSEVPCVGSFEGVEIVWVSSPLLDMKKELSDENEVIDVTRKH